jgi:hypothetical protein
VADSAKISAAGSGWILDWEEVFFYDDFGEQRRTEVTSTGRSACATQLKKIAGRILAPAEHWRGRYFASASKLLEKRTALLYAGSGCSAEEVSWSFRSQSQQGAQPRGAVLLKVKFFVFRDDFGGGEHL